jgi:hypothetical protein
MDGVRDYSREISLDISQQSEFGRTGRRRGEESPSFFLCALLFYPSQAMKFRVLLEGYY